MTTISAQIPKELSDALTKVAKVEDRSKSYYIKKSLEQFLKTRLENLEDYQDAQQEYDEFIASGESSVSADKVFKNIK